MKVQKIGTSELAILWNVSRKTIFLWSKTWLKPAKTDTGKFDIKKIYPLYLKHIIEPLYKTSNGLDSIENARRRYENARAKRWEMEVENKQNCLITLNDFQQQFTERVSIFKTALLILQ